MFTILLSDQMQPFYNNISSFPTIVFSFLFVLALLYWCCAIVGLVDLELLDFHPEASTASQIKIAEVVAGLLLRFKISAVPVTILMTFFSVYGWIICYFTVHYCLSLINNLVLYYVLSFLVLMISSVVALWLSACSVQPFKRFFHGSADKTHHQLIGKKAQVRTSRVDNQFGEAVLTHNGVEITLKVRHFNKEPIGYDDWVILLEYEAAENFYHVALNE